MDRRKGFDEDSRETDSLDPSVQGGGQYPILIGCDQPQGQRELDPLATVILISVCDWV